MTAFFFLFHGFASDKVCVLLRFGTVSEEYFRMLLLRIQNKIAFKYNNAFNFYIHVHASIKVL